jgi:hypothetical protein
MQSANSVPVAAGMQLKNISGIGTFAVEWEGDEGRRYQLSAGHGEETLWFSALGANERWASRPVINPERFGVRGPLRKFRDFQQVARQFTDAIA